MAYNLTGVSYIKVEYEFYHGGWCVGAGEVMSNSLFGIKFNLMVLTILVSFFLTI
jgi:hypothetical protein